MAVTAPVLLAAVLLLGWTLTTRLGSIPEYLLPSPGAVGARLMADLASGELWPYLGLTLTEALGGCLLGAAVAIPLAVAIHRLRWFRAAVPSPSWAPPRPSRRSPWRRSWCCGSATDWGRSSCSVR